MSCQVHLLRCSQMSQISELEAHSQRNLTWNTKNLSSTNRYRKAENYRKIMRLWSSNDNLQPVFVDRRCFNDSLLLTRNSSSSAINRITRWTKYKHLQCPQRGLGVSANYVVHILAQPTSMFHYRGEDSFFRILSDAIGGIKQIFYHTSIVRHDEWEWYLSSTHLTSYKLNSLITIIELNLIPYIHVKCHSADSDYTFLPAPRRPSSRQLDEFQDRIGSHKVPYKSRLNLKFRGSRTTLVNYYSN